MLSPFLVRSGRAGSLNRNACIVLHVCVYIGRRAQVTEVTYVQKSERAHGALELLTCLMSEHVRAMVPFLCNDVSQLNCGVWRCRMRAWCAPIRSVRHVYGGGSLRGSLLASFRVLG